MPNLYCDVVKCSYNTDEYCSLSSITVGGNRATNATHTECTQFVSSEYIASNNAHEPVENLLVKCEATACIHNAHQICQAEAIRITAVPTVSDSEDTECADFVSR